MTENPSEQQNRLNARTRWHNAHLWLKNHLANRVGGCVLCGSNTRGSPLSGRICNHCLGDMPHTLLDEPPAHRCAQCAHLLVSDGPICGDCLRAPPAFTHSVAFGDYAGALQHALLQYKFHHALHLAPLLADCLNHTLRYYAQNHATPDLIVLVPALPERTQARGFNPLRLIAQQINWNAIWPSHTPQYAPDALVRVHHEQLQIHVKPDQRRAQVKHAFAWGQAPSVHDRHILLIDDIITTGATLNEIARLLQQSGARQVDNLLIARTPKATNK